MVPLKVHVIEVTFLAIFEDCNLIVTSWHVALFVEVLWSYLGDVHIDHVAIVGVHFDELVLRQVLGVNIMVDRNMLVREDDVRLVSWNSWS